VGAGNPASPKAERALELRIPGRFDPLEIDRLALGVVCEERPTVRASLLRGTAEVATGHEPGRAGEVPPTLDVRFGPPLDLAPCDQLAVRIEGVERVGIHSIEAYRDPPGAGLPAVGEPRLMEIDGDYRLAAALVSERPAETRFAVQPGHLLSVTFGLPSAGRGPLEPLEIELELTGDGGLKHTYGLSFEHELVVIYSEHSPEYLKERAIRQQLMRVDPVNRPIFRQQLEANYRSRQNPLANFGEAPSQKKPARDPASVPQGLIEGWIQRTIDLEPFVGQEVVARFELVPSSAGEALCALANPVLIGDEAEPKGVLLVTSDAHRADHLSAGGVYGAIETPWLEIWGRRGTVFPNAWSSSNDPRAALGALHTGFPPAGGAPDGPTLAQRFAQAGWSTLAVLSSAEIAPEDPLLLGFERVVVPVQEDSAADVAVDALVERLADLEGQSFFAWLQLSDARAPYDPPQEFRRAHYPAGADPRDAAERGAPPAWLDEGIADLGYVEALYSGEVTWLDRRLRALVEHPRLARSTIAFAGTCGESLSTFDHARLCADTLRVPLLLCGPGLAVRSFPGAVGTIDLGRTLLDRAGLGALEFPGRSLLGRDARAEPQAAQFAIDGAGARAAVVRGEYLLELALPGADDGGETRLYDVEIDGEGTVDVSSALPELALELRGLLEGWLADPALARATGPGAPPAEAPATAPRR
jgi:hypothetical protein